MGAEKSPTSSKSETRKTPGFFCNSLRHLSANLNIYLEREIKKKTLLASGRMLANQPNHGAMRTTLSIYRDCIKSAARGNSPFANDWAWASGTPASQWVARRTTPFAGSTVALIRWAGSGDLMSAILDGILAAGAAFFVTWMGAF